MESGGQRRRITIIDDHAEFLALMQDVLSVHHDVVTMSGRDLTPDDIVDSRPDLLLIDLRLDTRDLQGSDILALVRSHRHLRKVPVIVCSADAQALNGRADAILARGNTAILSKPFTVDTLEEIVGLGLSRGFSSRPVLDAAADRFDGSNSTDAILIADQTGRYVDANDAALSLLGLTREELCRRSVADVVATDRAWTDAEWERYRRDGWWQGGVTLRLAGNRTRRMLATAGIVEGGEQPAYVSWLQPIEEGIAAG